MPRGSLLKQIFIRVPEECEKKAEELLVRLERLTPGVTMSNVWRAAVQRGLDILDAELPAAGPKAARKPRKPAGKRERKKSKGK